MPDVLSADRQTGADPTLRPRTLDVPAYVRAAMVVLGFIPLLHLLATLRLLRSR